MAAVRGERGRRLKRRQGGTSLDNSVYKSAYWGLHMYNILISLTRTERRSQVDELRILRQHQGRTEHVHFENMSAAEDAQQVVVSTIQRSVFMKLYQKVST